jgi:hypothetical protein
MDRKGGIRDVISCHGELATAVVEFDLAAAASSLRELRLDHDVHAIAGGREFGVLALQNVCCRTERHDACRRLSAGNTRPLPRSIGNASYLVGESLDK